MEIAESLWQQAGKANVRVRVHMGDETEMLDKWRYLCGLELAWMQQGRTRNLSLWRGGGRWVALSEEG